MTVYGRLALDLGLLHVASCVIMGEIMQGPFYCDVGTDCITKESRVSSNQTKTLSVV